MRANSPRMRSIAILVQFLAFGWAAMIIALPHLNAHMALLVGVAVGLVLGVMQAITPMGLAIVMTLLTGSRSIIPTEGFPRIKSQFHLRLLCFLCSCHRLR